MQEFTLTINDKTFKDFASYGLAFEDIRNSTKTANGTTVISHVATKAKISVGWKVISNDRLREIAAAVSNTGKNELRYYDYTRGAYTEGEFYIDNRSAAISHFDAQGSPLWEEYALTFIEA